MALRVRTSVDTAAESAVTRSSRLRAAILDAVFRVDTRERPIVDQLVERGVDGILQRVVAAAEANRKGPTELGLGIIGVHVTQTGVGMTVNVVGDARRRHSSGVEIPLREVADHIAF